MGQSTPIKTRNRTSRRPLTAEEAAERAQQLFAGANLLPVGNARTRMLKEACDYRMLAEMKRAMAPSESSSRKDSSSMQ
jgi:hypothetical protein